MEDTKPSNSPAPARKKRRLRKVLVAFGLLAIGLVAGLPRLLGTAPARSWLVGRINSRLAPGSVELEGLGLSWTGPIELSGVGLRDPKGKLVLAARRVGLGRGVLGLLASRPDYGTITIEGATVDVERRADGSIDVLDALASAFRADPSPQAGGAPVPVPGPSPTPALSKVAASVVLKGGTLRVASPELVEPIAAGSLDGSVTISPGKPIELAITLGDEGRSLEIRSTIDQDPSSDPPGDRALTVVGKGWPIHVRRAGVEAKGRFEGTLAARQDRGLWAIKGDAALVGVEAGGPTLRGDRLTLDRVAAACDLGRSSTGWTVRKLDLTSPVASLQAVGSIPALDGTPATLRGRVDLAALARMLPDAMRLRDGLVLDRGTATIRGDLTTSGGADRFEMAASLDDFAATEAGRAVTLRQAVRLTARAVRTPEKVSVEAIEVKASGVDVTAGGDLEAGVKLNGTVDLPALAAQLRDVLDLGGFDLAGHARLAADCKTVGDSFKGRFAADCKDLKVVGMAAGPIARDLVRLDASAVGPIGPGGIPADWHEARLDLKAGDLKLDLVATSKGGDVGLVGGAGMDVASPVPGRLEAKATFRRKGSVLDVDELRAGITPSDPRAAAGVVALAVRGRLDLASGEGQFGPIPAYAVGAVGLGPGGAKVSGLGRADAPLGVDASLVGDLAALDRLLASWSGSPLKGYQGGWSGRWSVARSVAGRLDVDGKLDVPAIVAAGLTGRVSMALKGGYSPDVDRLDLETLDLLTGYGRAVVSGKLLEAKGRKLMELTGTVAPDWAAIDPIVASKVEPNARFRATARPIRLAGSLKADTTPQILAQMAGEVGLDLTMAEAFGVTLTPAAVVLKMDGGRAAFDPVVTTMNGGAVILCGDLGLDADYGLWLRLKTSRIDGAAINEAVSNSVLSYVAPVLAKSSGVTGKVTVGLNRAALPITADGSMSFDGGVAFQNVVFKPGPLGAELTSITGQAAPDLKLDQVMAVWVANGRVRQNGLSIPIGGNGLRVAIDGSVGFDESLDLKATIPLTARALGLDPKLDKAVGGATVALPIRGTLARPAVDRKGLNLALRNAAKALGEKELKSEAGRFLERIAGPNQPGGEPRSKPGQGNPLKDLEGLGREILDPKKP